MQPLTPNMGLETVTCVPDGAIVHDDGLDSEAVRLGGLNGKRSFDAEMRLVNL